MPQRDQAPHVLGRRLDGHAGQRHVRGAAVVSRGEGEAELPRGEPRVVFEHLIEVAHPEEQDGIRVPSLDLAVLLHQRGVGLDPGRHGSSTTNG